MDIEKTKLRIDLMRAKVDILKLKADDYNWQCHTRPEVKASLEKTLEDIEVLLKDLDGNTENINGPKAYLESEL